VIATDASSGMVEALAAARSDLDVRLMDASALAFDDATFDVVTAGFVMHLLDDLRCRSPAVAGGRPGPPAISGTARCARAMRYWTLIDSTRSVSPAVMAINDGRTVGRIAPSTSARARPVPNDAGKDARNQVVQSAAEQTRKQAISPTVKDFEHRGESMPE